MNKRLRKETYFNLIFMGYTSNALLTKKNYIIICKPFWRIGRVIINKNNAQKTLEDYKSK